MLNFIRRDYKSRFFETAIIGSIFLFGIFLIGCESIPSVPNPTTAENIPGLSVNPENSAYLGGRIRAIGDYDFDPGSGAMGSYPERTLCVPAGVKMTVWVHYSYFYYVISFLSYEYGFKLISIPPLENGGVYRLYIKRFGSRVVLEKFNNDTKKHEKVEGATFSGQ